MFSARRASAMRASNEVSPSGSSRKPESAGASRGSEAAATRPSVVSATSLSAALGGRRPRGGSDVQPAAPASIARHSKTVRRVAAAPAPRLSRAIDGAAS